MLIPIPSQSAYSHNGLHWEDVSSLAEDLLGSKQHVCIFQVVGLTGRSVTLLWWSMVWEWQSMPCPGGLMIIGPGSPVTRSTGGGRVELRFQTNHRPPSPSAHVDEKSELLAECGIQTAVDERVVAGGAHSQPVKAEVKGIGGVNGLTG